MWRFLVESTNPLWRADNNSQIMDIPIFSHWCDHCVITYPRQIKTFPGHCCNEELQKWWRPSHKSRQGTTLCSFPSSCQNQMLEQMKCKLQLCHTYFWDVMSWPKKDTNLFILKKETRTLTLKIRSSIKWPKITNKMYVISPRFIPQVYTWNL